jgi:hypothetical protein
MDFEPPNAITLHLIVFKMANSVVWQRFYAFSASPIYLRRYLLNVGSQA